MSALAALAATSPQAPGVTLDVVNAKAKLDVAATHAAALAIRDQLQVKQVEPKHAQRFFENVTRKEGTAQQMKGDCMACGLSLLRLAIM